LSNLEPFYRHGTQLPTAHREERRSAVSATQQKKAFKGMGMEGLTAKWYAKNTAKSIEQFKKEAQEIAHHLPNGSVVLEVAPGPGFLAIELAKAGSYRIVGLDISKSFVRIATENATKAGVEVTFREGNASSMPFESDCFDFVVCRAAFKNFSEPVQALHEMYRVLKQGGRAVIFDLRRDATSEAINAAVREMGLGWVNSLLTRWILRWLRKRAYSQEQFRRMVGETPFRTCEIKSELIGAEIVLCK
jgi:ubiquinone/menaquinone biosynthesis C-methylase UbiE